MNNAYAVYQIVKFLKFSIKYVMFENVDEIETIRVYEYKIQDVCTTKITV